MNVLTDPNADAAKWHRFFAIECNNLAWGLAVAPRGPADDRRMLDAAHASAWHWRHAGDERNHMRATMLLAEVHALLGMGASAMAYAREMSAHFLDADTADWELALTHTVLAHAAAAAGDSALHARAHADAEAVIASVADPDDRAIVLQTFELVPRPSGATVASPR